jgi:hypothetical protein
VGQIWAEAVEFYRQKEPLVLSETLRQEAKDIRERHTDVDDRQGHVERYLETLLPEKWEEMNIYERRAYLNNEDPLQPEGTQRREAVCVAEVWSEALGGTTKDMNTHSTKAIHNILRRVKGWEPGKLKRFGIYGPQRAYVRSTGVNTNFSGRFSSVNTVNTNVNTN